MPAVDSAACTWSRRAGCVEGHARQPAVPVAATFRRRPRSDRHELQTGNVGEFASVVLVDRQPPRRHLRQPLELRPAHRCQQVAQAVVETDVGVLVVDRRLTGLRRQVPHAVGHRRVGRQQRTAARGGDDLVAVERQDPDVAQRARGAASVCRTQCLGGILHQRDPVLRTQRSDLVVVGALAVQVDGHDRRRSLARPRSASASSSASSCGSMFHDAVSLSTKRGVAPVYITAFAVAANVNDDTITSSPGPTPFTSNARCSAAVPLDIATVPGHPVNVARSASNPSSSGPTGATHPLSKARSSASRSSCPTSGELSRIGSGSPVVTVCPPGRRRVAWLVKLVAEHPRLD